MRRASTCSVAAIEDGGARDGGAALHGSPERPVLGHPAVPVTEYCDSRRMDRKSTATIIREKDRNKYLDDRII